MKLFPDHWANPDVLFEIVATPIGTDCTGCNSRILKGDHGLILLHVPSDEELRDGITQLVWHSDCFRRALEI